MAETKRKLWLLSRVGPLKNSPWEPWHDKCVGAVVSATSEEAARAAIDDLEGPYGDCHPWLTKKWVSCVELIAEDHQGLVLTDVWGA